MPFALSTFVELGSVAQDFAEEAAAFYACTHQTGGSSDATSAALIGGAGAASGGVSAGCCRGLSLGTLRDTTLSHLVPPSAFNIELCVLFEKMCTQKVVVPLCSPTPW